MFALFFVMGIFVLLFRGRRVQLWLSREHLLMVETDGYTEYYRRFDYGDIQWFVIRKTVEGGVINIVLGVLVLVLFRLGFTVVDQVGRGFLFGFTAFFGLLFVINILRGPTCRCQLRTAVQTVDMVSLRRLRSARKVLAAIRPMIEQEQGAFDPGRLQPASDAGQPARMPDTGTPQ
jgi:hypothetical protein